MVRYARTHSYRLCRGDLVLVIIGNTRWYCQKPFVPKKQIFPCTISLYKNMRVYTCEFILFDQPESLYNLSGNIYRRFWYCLNEQNKIVCIYLPVLISVILYLLSSTYLQHMRYWHHSCLHCVSLLVYVYTFGDQHLVKLTTSNHGVQYVDKSVLYTLTCWPIWLVTYWFIGNGCRSINTI